LYVCELEFAFEQTLASRSAKRVFAFAQRQSGAPLLEQEFALREATVGKGLEVQYEYIRTPTDRNNEYTLKLSVKCDQNNYAKVEPIIAVQA